MASEKGAEGTPSKLLLLIIDKLLLGVIVAVFAYSLNVSLQRQVKGIDYQKAIFDRRVEAYLDVLQKTRNATDGLALYWISREQSGLAARHSKLEGRWRRLTGVDGGFGSRGHWADLTDVLPLLKEVESAWSSKSIYFSEPVSHAVNEFLGTVYADLEERQALAEQRKKSREAGEVERADDFDDKAAWLRAQEAFDRLNAVIRGRLQLDGIILG